MASQSQDEQRLALFIDFENIAIGVRDAHYRKFDINLVLERLLDKGKVLSKRAYADWSRYSDYKRSFHEAAVELIEVPQKSLGGKNSADIRLVVDAMDMSFQKEHINAFVVASGDSDFSPLVSKLKENNKYVIGLGVKNSTSDLLIENCDEFIFYEDLVRGQQRPIPVIANVPEKVQEGFSLLVDSILALQRENKEILWGSMVKETMKRKKPSFNETYYGFRTFSHLLEDAQRRGIVTLRRDQRSGSYIVEDLGSASVAGASAKPEAVSSAPAPAPAPAPALAQRPLETPTPEPSSAESNGARSLRRRRGRGRRRPTSILAQGAFINGTSAPTPPEGHEDAHDEGHEDDHEEELSSAEESHEDTPHPHEEETPHPTSAEPGRSPFSFFSWIRREPEPAPETPPQTEPTKPRDDET